MIRNIVIVGGGSAGWLTAAILASRVNNLQTGSSNSSAAMPVQITLIESPDIPTVGVGEGSWPSMRSTLRDIGISETEFMRRCHATLKQGTRFQDWLRGQDESYYHPFSLPVGFNELNVAEFFSEAEIGAKFAEMVCAQTAVCEHQLSAKTISTPEFAFNLNYGYHLDAGEFVSLLREHCVERLNVELKSCNVTSVEKSIRGAIKSVLTDSYDAIHGDLFVDCTGFEGLLIRKALNVPRRSVRTTLFNDRAIAAQIPYAEDHRIASVTNSIAQPSGWVWDIGLSHRRGTGLVYSSEFMSDADAQAAFRTYLVNHGVTDQESADRIDCRQLKFDPGYSEQAWYKNVVAIGLSAGFVEPLEASALVLIETSAKALASCLPLGQESMDANARQFNRKIDYHWQQIIDFLKLHYVLSKRVDGDYWREHRCDSTIPASLKELLAIWRYRMPWYQDAPRVDELFSSASFQYVLFGMEFERPASLIGMGTTKKSNRAKELITKNNIEIKRMLSTMPTNNELAAKVHEYGFQAI